MQKKKERKKDMFNLNVSNLNKSLRDKIAVSTLANIQQIGAQTVLFSLSSLC